MKRVMTVATIMFFALSIVDGNLKAAQANYSLTKEDVEFLKQLAKKDKFIQDLPKGVTALEGLNKIFSLTVPGPVSLVLQWNKGLIAGWRKANEGLAKIAKFTVCQDIITY